MPPHAVDDIVGHLMDQLVSGVYPPGCRLPTTRALAAELGVHRNTVAKAYKSLAGLGLLATSPGRGTFAAARPETADGRPRTPPIDDRLDEIIRRARRGNIAEDALRRRIDQRIAAIYHAPSPRAAFVECNEEDLSVAVGEIEQLSGIRLAPTRLDALAAAPERVAAEYDLIFTSLFHLMEVREALADAPSRRRVIGVYTQPDERALAEIAQIGGDERVGIVVSNDDGARRYAAQIQTFTQAATRALVRPTDDEVASLARDVDVLVASRSRMPQARRAANGVPVIELSFHISRASAELVAEAMLGDGG
ncbi:MAG TPA: GntR family transcriptional regulator [Thermomicrobiales bacterium]|nr:GntR family transcriptional regulator [Thermomicrobiales bacterium]